jgi:hypothetical protein
VRRSEAREAGGSRHAAGARTQLPRTRRSRGRLRPINGNVARRRRRAACSRNLAPDDGLAQRRREGQPWDLVDGGVARCRRAGRPLELERWREAGWLDAGGWADMRAWAEDGMCGRGGSEACPWQHEWGGGVITRKSEPGKIGWGVREEESSRYFLL